MTINNLYKTLKQRKCPEDVAQMVLDVLGKQLSFREKRLLAKAAKGALRNTFGA